MGPRRMANLVRCAVLAVLLAGSLPAGEAEAQSLTDGSYTIDLTDLPVLGAPRAVGLGGAYGAVGEGAAAAMAWNPAAVATRGHWEHDWFEWDVAFGAILPSTMDSSHFFGADGGTELPTKDFQFFDAGLRLQFGPVGVGVLVRPRVFEVPVSGLGDVNVTAQTIHSDAAIALMDGTIVVGVGFRFANLAMSVQGRSLLDVQGTGFEGGVTYRPIGEGYRLSAVVRSPILVNRVVVDPALDAVHSVPRSVGFPWELAFGGGFGFGERPLNPTLVVDPRRRERRRRERELRRQEEADASAQEDSERPPPEPTPADRPRYGLVTGELVVQGRLRDAVGLDGFLQETRRTWGDRVTVSPRVGIEGEPWRNRMKLRGGTYLEPARSSVTSPRMHFTHGFDFRVFDFDLFDVLDEPISVQVTFTGDVARQYAAFGFGVGIWH